jgi:hypothetical protein
LAGLSHFSPEIFTEKNAGPLAPLPAHDALINEGDKRSLQRSWPSRDDQQPTQQQLVWRWVKTAPVALAAPTPAVKLYPCLDA